MARRRTAVVAVVFIILVIYLSGSRISQPPALLHSKQCPPSLDHLRTAAYNLSSQITYQKRCFRATQNGNVDRTDVASVAIPQNKPVRLDLANGCGEEPPCTPIDIQLPAPFPRRDYKEFLFGVASPYDRLEASIPHFQRWLGGTKARLVALVSDVDGLDKSWWLWSLMQKFDNAGVKLIAVRPDDPTVHVNEQHFLLVRELLKHATSTTDWAVIVDDDTFFPSLAPVAQLLDALDASQPAYVGSLTSNRRAIEDHGRMAFGGGGIFLSVPLLRELRPHVDDCWRESDKREGDGMLQFCIGRKTDTKLTAIDGLNQLDMSGDMGGFYESGRLPLSLHHWKTWHNAPVDHMATVAKFCGPCLLQRWRLGENEIWANGYSVARYDKGTKGLKLDEMEATWDGAHNHTNWEWSYGPMRDPVAAKTTYKLIDAKVLGNVLRQVYRHRSADGDDVLEVSVEL